MNLLFLDDDRMRAEAFRKTRSDCVIHWVKTASECKEILRAAGGRVYQEAHLDHDLLEKHYIDLQGDTFEDTEGSGTEVAEFMAANPGLCPTKIVIHSYNPRGAQRMRDILAGAGLVAELAPFNYGPHPTWEIAEPGSANVETNQKSEPEWKG